MGGRFLRRVRPWGWAVAFLGGWARGGEPSGRAIRTGAWHGRSAMYYVYVLQSEKDGQFYTGSTPDLRRRFGQHCEGKVMSTKSRRPLKLIYYEASLEKDDAIRRERYLKTGTGKRYLRNRLKKQLEEV